MPGSQEKPSGWLVACPSIRSTTLYTAMINPLRGLLARAQRSYRRKILENRGTRWKAQSKRRAKRSNRASKQMWVNPLLVAERVALAGYIIPPGICNYFIPFSAFWLRSSVVSVLISLISDTRLIEPHDINLIFLGGGVVR